MHLEGDDDSADFFRGALQLNPVPGRQRRRRVVVVQLYVDVHRAPLLLSADETRELPRFAGANEPEEVLEAMLVGEPPVLGCKGRGQAVEAGGGDGHDFLFERPLAGRRRMPGEGPEVGDVDELGHDAKGRLLLRSVCRPPNAKSSLPLKQRITIKSATLAAFLR